MLPNMITLAELPTPSANAIATWLVSLVSVVVGINAVLKLTDRARRTPANETLGLQHTALHDRVDAIEENVKILRKEISDHNETMSRETSIHRRSLYQQIDGTRKELEGKMEANRKELAQDIKDMPSQVVALLKNTNAI